MVMSANPHTMLPYASPITNGALAGDTNGFAGSKHAQITMPCQLAFSFYYRNTHNKAINKELGQEDEAGVGLVGGSGNCTGYSPALHSQRLASLPRPTSP